MQKSRRRQKEAGGGRRRQEEAEAWTHTALPVPSLVPGDRVDRRGQGVWFWLESHQSPEEKKKEGPQLKKRTQPQSWKGRGPGVRHAGDKFKEPQQGIWSYACQSDEGYGGRER